MTSAPVAIHLICLILHRLQWPVHIDTCPICTSIEWANQMSAQDEGCLVPDMLPASAKSRQRHLYRRCMCDLPSKACNAQMYQCPWDGGCQLGQP